MSGFRNRSRRDGRTGVEGGGFVCSISELIDSRLRETTGAECVSVADRNIPFVSVFFFHSNYIEKRENAYTPPPSPPLSHDYELIVYYHRERESERECARAGRPEFSRAARNVPASAQRRTDDDGGDCVYILFTAHRQSIEKYGNVKIVH